MTEVIKVRQIWIEKANVANTKVVEQGLDLAALPAGDAVLKVDSFGFSANNITYAVFGDKMAYWGFFPADDRWGIVPVWGFATVVASKHPDVLVGEKVYGYLPMASHLVISPGKTSDTHFFDIGEKRKSISPVYDNYVRCATDPSYQVNSEAWQLNYRPLFMTSFVLEDFVGEGLQAAQEKEQDIKQVILTSASSKTAYGAAHLLMKHKASRGEGYQVIGCTSPGNKKFTEDLGCYDQVLTYDEVLTLPKDQASWVLDFAGNKALLLGLQAHMASCLVKLVLIGSTDVDAQQDKPEGHLQSEFFFAPSQVKMRTGQWGHAGFEKRYTQGWQGFSQHMLSKITVAHYSGTQAIQQLYQIGLAGKLNNLEINVLTF
jgi:hypothetical protein